jgi:membrane protein YqaA with SNARE-associated domain
MKNPKRQVQQIMTKTKEKIGQTQRRIVDYTAKQQFGLGFWIFLVVTFVLGALFFSNIEQFIKVSVTKYGYLGIFILSIMTELVVQPVGPDVPLIAGILMKLNPWMVFLSVILGSYFAILISYYIGKKLGGPGIERIMGPKKYKKLAEYEQKGKWFLLIGALTPVPYVPYLAGVWSLSFKDTLLYVAIPRTVRLFIVFGLAYYLGIFLFN